MRTVNIIMFSCLLIGALIESDYKWGFFVFAVVSLLYIAYHLLTAARGSARLMGVDWGRTYTRSAGLLVFVWALYVSRTLRLFGDRTDLLLTQPVCWALSEGANVMGTSGELIFYSTSAVVRTDLCSLLALILLFAFRHPRHLVQACVPVSFSKVKTDKADRSYPASCTSWPSPSSTTPT